MGEWGGLQFCIFLSGKCDEEQQMRWRQHVRAINGLLPEAQLEPVPSQTIGSSTLEVLIQHCQPMTVIATQSFYSRVFSKPHPEISVTESGNSTWKAWVLPYAMASFPFETDIPGYTMLTPILNCLQREVQTGAWTLSNTAYIAFLLEPKGHASVCLK